MKIYDGFMYMNEVDIGALRLHYLAPHVDRFIVVEGTSTFTGKLRKPRFQKLLQLMPEHIQDKVEHITVTFPLSMNNPWEREAFQRNAISRGIPADYDEHDLILISDCDEIPNAQWLDWLREPGNIDALGPERAAVFMQDLYFYTPHWRHVEPWYGTRLREVKAVLRGGCQSLRSTRRPLRDEMIFARLFAGGWSFSYFGGVEAIQEKVGAYSHTEVDKIEYTNREHIEESIEKGLPLVRNDGNKFEYVENPQVPDFMRAYPDSFGLRVE